MRQIRKGFLWAMWLGVSTAATTERPCLAQSSQPATTATAIYLTRKNDQLSLDSRPFRAVGVNKYELLDLYVAELLGEDSAAAAENARQSLDELKRLGVDVVRVQGSQFWPAHMLKTYLGGEDRRREFWQRYDRMLADCSQRGIRVVLAVNFYLGLWPDLAHESLHDFVCNPHSRSREMFEQWLRDLVGRYRDDPTILFWELPNEMNLVIDLRPQFPEGMLKWSHPQLMPGPVVRDASNNITSEELAAFFREITLLIKSLDPNHLVGTGCSIPRPAAWHLWMGSLRRSPKMNWTADTDEQQADHLRLITPDAIDLICVHLYLGGQAAEKLERLSVIAETARQLGKPLYIGECGVQGRSNTEEVYGQAGARADLQRLLDTASKLDIPITLLWTYNEHARTLHEPVIWPDRQPEVVEMLRAAQAEAKQRAIVSAGQRAGVR